VAASVAGVVLALLWTVPAAACGPHLHRSAARDAVDGARAPLVIGDSVVAGAVPEIARAGFEVDAQCARQMSAGLAMIRARRAAGTLPRMIVWALGTNGPQRYADVVRLRRVVGTSRTLVLVTPRGPVPWTGPTAAAYRRAARKWRTVVLADWARTSSGRAGWLAPDGIHLQARGAAGYARMLRATLRHFPRPEPAIDAFVPIPGPPAAARRVALRTAGATVTRDGARDAAVVGPAGSRAGRGTVAKQGGCGGVRVVGPSRRTVPGRAPLVIGDSVLLGAMPEAARVGFTVDAHGCRQIGEGTAVVRRLARAGRLPRLVVVQLGTNGVVTESDVRRLLRLLGPERSLALVTPRAAGGADNRSAHNMRRIAARTGARVTLVDWQRDSAGRSSWFQPDGIHLTPSGAAALARRLRALLPLARPLPPEPPAFQAIP